MTMTAVALRLCRCRVDAVGQLAEGVRLKSAVKQHQRQAANGDQAFHVEAAVEHSVSNHATKETLPSRESVEVAYKLRFLNPTGQAEPKLPSLARSDAMMVDRLVRARLRESQRRISNAACTVATQRKSAMPAAGM